MFKGKKILELGCGQGLPGIAALIYGEASLVLFQDYNQEVVENATKTCVGLNLKNKPELWSSAQFIAGSWDDAA